MTALRVLFLSLASILQDLMERTNTSLYPFRTSLTALVTS
uniref:Secreted protein n=1 Tax=Steinernema glaseri TaxID=37863 RepID=A0A1I8ANY4_9BILA